MRNIIVIAIAILCTSCITYPVPGRLKKVLNCYSGKYTGLDTLINTQGYYSLPSGVQSKSLSEIIFFNDGIFIGNIGCYQSTNTSECLDQMVRNGQAFSIRAFYQGTYNVSGDTIKVQYISTGSANVYFGIEMWYKIIDKNTIVDFYQKHLGLTWEDRNKEIYQPKFYSSSNYLKFVSTHEMPESSSWLKNEKWFYCK